MEPVYSVLAKPKRTSLKHISHKGWWEPCDVECVPEYMVVYNVWIGFVNAVYNGAWYAY